MRDALGVEHPCAPPNARIASLVPSLTELLFSVGLGPQIVARTGFCIHPSDQVLAVPKVGGTKDVNLEKLRQLKPDYVLVNIDENRRETAEALREFVPHVVVTHPLTLQDNLFLFDYVGHLFAATAGVREKAQALHAQLAAQLTEQLAAQVDSPLTGHRPAQLQRATPRVLYLIWRDPWMTVSESTYVADVLRCAGAQLVDVQESSAGSRYPAFELTKVDWQQVDAVFLSSEPYSFNQDHADELHAQYHLPCLCVDGEPFSWYGSRSLTSLAYAKAQLERIRLHHAARCG